MVTNDFPPRKCSGWRRPARVKWFLVLLLLGFYSLPARPAASTNLVEFARTLPQLGSVRWQNEQRLSEESQDAYRKRLAIPDAQSPFVPRDTWANLINGRKAPALPAAPEPPAVRVFNPVFFTAMILLAGWLIARRLAPQILIQIGRQLNPLALPPADEWEESPRVRDKANDFGQAPDASEAGSATTGTTLAAKDSHEEFYPRAHARLDRQRKLFEKIRHETDDAALRRSLVSLYFEFGGLKDEANFPEVLPVWQLASAAEGLLKELAQRIRKVSPSTLRAIAGGLEALDRLCVHGLPLRALTERPFKFLVVDDDLVSRQALALALGKAFCRPDLAVDAEAALALSSRQSYDVIFLDVQMPGMDGFELCSKIRSADLNRLTPIIFVTAHSDFDARSRSLLSGGNDLMGKPFLIFEITLQALAHAFQARLEAGGHKAAPAVEANPAAAASSAPLPDNAPPMPTPVIAHRPARPAAPTRTDADVVTFLNRAAEQLEPLRELCQALLNTADEARRQNLLADAFLRLNSLVSLNDRETEHPAYQVCAAVEGLVRKLLQNAKHSTPSALATVHTAVELLNDLCLPGMEAGLVSDPPIQLLVVDDDVVARRALAGALQTAFSKPESVEDGNAALGLAGRKVFDVIFLDIQMPGMDGFEVCAKIRESAPNRATPVVFVTNHADFASRVQMSRTGGNDLVGKPFLTSEITVKALTYAVRGRLQRNDAPLSAAVRK